MPVSRRQFLKIAGISSLGAVIFKACGFDAEENLVESPVNLPEDLVTGTDNWYASTSGQCMGGCGTIVRVIEGRAKKVEGNPNHPLSRGKLCVRCQASVQALYHPDRITGPMLRSGPRGSGEYESISWNDAEAEIAPLLQGTSGGRTLLVTDPLRGRLAKVTKRFVDSLGMRHSTFDTLGSSTNLKAAMRQVFGQEQLPEFDLENTNFLLGFGADLLENWLSSVRYARGYGHFRQGDHRERGTFVHVDSRFSMTAANADKWVPVRPGMEGILALSLAYVIVREELGDKDAADAMTEGRGFEALAPFAPNLTATMTGVSEHDTIYLARRFANEQPSLAIGGSSAGAHTNGLYNLAAIYSLNALVGNLGVEGGLHFNPSPISPGAGDSLPDSTFKDWQEIANDMGNVDLLMVRNVDPVHGLPEDLGFQEALRKVPHIVSFSSFMDDTTTQADLILPDSTDLESWGDIVPDAGPGYEMVSFQQPVVAPFQDSRAFGDALIGISQRLGGDVAVNMPWASLKEAVQESAQELFGLNRGNLTVEGSFEAFWNGLLQRGVWYDQKSRPNSTVELQPLPTDVNSPVFQNAPHEEGMNLIVYATNSMLDGRLAHLPWLQATPDPMTTVVWDTWVDISREDARRLEVKSNDILEVRSQYGAIEAPAYVNRGTPPGTVCVPLSQGHTGFGRWAENRGTNVMSILAPLTDPNTGALAYNATRVKVTKTNRQRTLPKFEGVVEALPAPTVELIQIANGKGDSH